MVAISPNLDYGLYGDHTFAKNISPFAPFVQLSCLSQNGHVKSSDD